MILVMEFCQGIGKLPKNNILLKNGGWINFSSSMRNFMTSFWILLGPGALLLARIQMMFSTSEVEDGVKEKFPDKQDIWMFQR